MIKYYYAINYGHGFITHEDNELAHISGYPGNIWVTENTIWPQRIGAIEKTKEEAQAIVDAAIAESYQPPSNNEQQNPPQVILP